MLLVSVLLIWLYFFKPQFIKENSIFEEKKINIQQYTLTPKPWNLFLLNLKLISSWIYNTKWIQAASQLYIDSVKLFNVNILNLLEDTKNKKIVLNTHVKQLENLKSKLDDSIVNISSLAQQEETKSQEYLSEKKHGDDQFSNGFNLKDTKMIVEGLNISRQNGPKHVEHRISANALNIISMKMKNIKYLLESKLLLLQNNQETIVTNYELIKWDLLKKLLELKQRLETERYN